MFNKKLLTSMIVAGGLSMAGMTSVMAHSEGMEPPPPPSHGGAFGPEMGPLGKIFQNIALSADQKQKVQIILGNAHANEVSKRAQLKSVREEIINTLLAPGKVEKGSFDSLVEKQTKVENELGAARAKTALEIRDVLTEDQLAQVKTRYTKLKGIAEQMKQLHSQAKETINGGTAAPSSDNAE